MTRHSYGGTVGSDGTYLPTGFGLMKGHGDIAHGDRESYYNLLALAAFLGSAYLRVQALAGLVDCDLLQGDLEAAMFNLARIDDLAHETSNELPEDIKAITKQLRLSVERTGNRCTTFFHSYTAMMEAKHDNLHGRFELLMEFGKASRDDGNLPHALASFAVGLELSKRFEANGEQPRRSAAALLQMAQTLGEAKNVERASEIIHVVESIACDLDDVDLLELADAVRAGDVHL